MLKNFAIKVRTHIATKKNLSERKTISFENAKSIGVLIEENKDKTDQSSVYKFIEEIKNAGKKVDVLYISKHDDKSKSKFNYSSLHSKDYSWNGNLKSANGDKFINSKYDFLFSLNKELSPKAKNILANSKAFCRIGRSKLDNNRFCEILIEPSKDNTNSFVDEMLFYTKKLTD